MSNHSKLLFRNLLRTVNLNQLSPIQIQIIIALRITVLAGQKNINVDNFLKKHFGDSDCAHHLKHLVESMNESWPERIYLNKPCCQTLSYDEMLIIDLFNAVHSYRHQYFHALLCEMVSKTYCDRLHHVIKQLTHSLNSRKAAL